MVIVDSTDAEIASAEAILKRRGIEEFGIYGRPDSRTATTDYVNATTPTTAVPADTTTPVRKTETKNGKFR